MVRGLLKTQAQKCLLGDACLGAAVRICRWLVSAQVPWILEHPAGSRAWQRTEVLRLIGLPGAVLIDLDQCLWGAAWRKRTRLLCWGLDSFAVDGLRRLCRVPGGCARTGQPHRQLSGRAADGRPWTSIASEYPRELANQMVKSLVAERILRHADLIDDAGRCGGLPF